MNRKNLFIIDIFDDDSYGMYFDSFATMSQKDMRAAFQKAPKDLTITIFGNKYLVNKLIISDISIFIFNLIHNDANLKEISLDSYFKSTLAEEKSSGTSTESLTLFGETLTKIFDVINGYRRKFDIRKEQKFLAKISRILCITLPSHLVVNQRREYDSQSFSGNIVEIELSSFSLFDFFMKSAKTFSLKFNDKEVQVNSIILTLSDVIYEEFEKKPDLKTYTFDLDDKQDELLPIIDFLSINSMILTTNNIDIILNAAETMKIQPIIDLANFLKKKFDESQTIYDNEEDKINFLIDLQDLLFNLNEENFDESLSSLIKKGCVSTKEDIKEFISNLCNAVMYRPKTRKLYVKLISQLKQNEILETLNKDDFFINFLIKYIISLSRNSLLICPLIYELYENEKIIDKKTLTRLIFKTIGCIENNSNKKVNKKIRKYTPSYSLIWFLPEMEEEYPIVFDLITNWDINCVFGQFFSIIKLNLDDFRQDNWKLFKESRSLMANPDPFAIVIANDDAEQLQVMCSKISFNFSTKIKMCLFENIEEISLLDYAAQHGSINCFKYMLLNGASIRNSTYNYAVIGGSTEIIHIIDNELGNNILTDINHDNNRLGDIIKQVATFYIPYGCYQLTNVLMSVMLKIYHYYFTNYMQLETVLISCIIYHRDEVFEWLMNKHLIDGKVLTLALCSIASIAYNNMKDFMLIVDSGLFIYSEFKNFDELLKYIIQVAALNGFSEIINMTISLYGADLINYSALDNVVKFHAFNNYYGDSLNMKGKSIFSEAAAFGSIKIVNNFMEQFNNLSSVDFIYAISKSIYNGNFDFAEFALNVQLFNQENEFGKTQSLQNSKENENQNDNDNDNKNDNAKIVKRNAVFINRMTIEEWILNAIKSCDKNNVQFVEYLISNLDKYFEKCGYKQKISDYLDKDLISSALLECVKYNDDKFFAWIVNHYINQIGANKIEECLLQASLYGYLTIINYCLITLSYLCTDSRKGLIIDVDNSQYVNEKEIHISQKIAKKTMQNAAKYGHHEVILYLIEKIPGIFVQFFNDAFKAALSQSRSLTCRNLLSNMSFQPTPELLILSIKSNLNEVVIKILEINHSSELLNSTSEEGTCLTVASSYSSIEIIQYLLDNFSSLIDPNIRNSNGDTALICAALHQRFDVIQILCDRFQKRLEMWQFNALIPAFFSNSNSNQEQKKNNEKIGMDGDFFVKFNPQEKEFQVRNMASNGIDLCYFLLNTFSTSSSSSSSSSIQSPTPSSSDIDKWDENDKFELDWNYLYNDMTPLMIAAKMNNLPLLQFLIGIDGVDVNARNVKNGDTALLIAAFNDNEFIVDALVNNKKTDIGIENNYGESVLIKSIIPNEVKISFHRAENRSANVISKIISSPNFSSQISQEQLGEALICAIINSNIAIFNNLLRIPNINVMHTSKMCYYICTNDNRLIMIRNWRDDSVALAAFYSDENKDFLAPILNHNTFDITKCNLQKAAILSVNKNMNTIYQPILNLLGGNVNVIDQESGISLLNAAILSCSSTIIPLILTSLNFDKEKNDIDNAITWDFTIQSSESNIIINTKFGPAQNQEVDFGRIHLLRHNDNDNQDENNNNENDNDNQDKKDENNNNENNNDNQDKKDDNSNDNDIQDKKDENNNNENDNDNQDKKDENNNDNDNQTKNFNDDDEINKDLCIKSYNNLMAPFSYYSIYLENQTNELTFGQGNVLKKSINSRLSFENLLEYQDRIDPNKTDIFGNNNFTYASFISPIAVDNLLRMKGADLNQQNKLNGMTTLMYACIFLPEMIRPLLENENIDINIKDFEGKTAFDHIVERYDLDIDEDFEQPSTREEFKDWIDQIHEYINSRTYKKNNQHQWSY